MELGDNIGYWDETIHVELNIALNLDQIADTAFGVMWGPKPVWKAGIEEIWSVNDVSRFGAPIQFHMNWADDSNRHLTVNVHLVVGNSTYATGPRNWEYNINRSYDAHGIDYTEYSRRIAAYEIGNQLRLYDEYAGGATNRFRPERMNSGGPMYII